MAASITYKIGMGGLNKFAEEANTPAEILALENLTATNYTVTVRHEDNTTAVISMTDQLRDNDTLFYTQNKAGA